MGLCKCPKRQVTNQFCFEHRVNVCEHCMVMNHTKCIVQSYLQWLKDSDYVSDCTLCSTTLENGECIRLICYHVFHWDCLNARQSSLSSNTPANGHKCPLCDRSIIPPSNLVSPVGDVVKNLLGQVNWGRNALGITMFSDDSYPSNTPAVSLSSGITSTTNVMTKVHHSNLDRIKSNGIYSNYPNKTENQHSILLMDAFTPPSNDSQANSRRPLLPRQTSIDRIDRDDNKYKRRTPAEIFSRWTRRFYAPSSRPPWRRTWFLVLSGLLIFAGIIALMASYGRAGSLEDEAWNKEPNVHY